MVKPNPITIIAVCIVALSLLAYTINDQLTAKNNTIHTAIASKNKKLEPFVAYNPPHGQPGHRHGLPDGAVLPNSIPNATTSATESTSLNNVATTAPSNINASGRLLNPPHGQPGHTCSIPVGAPLDSATIAQAKKITTTTKTTAGLNPPHGQPGHRCDIAVGAPLNSAPAKTTSTNKTTTASVAAGLNPPHGQPGHRCDIAVGAPLNSAAKQNTTAASANKLNSSLFPNYNFPNKDSATAAPPVSAPPKFEYDSTGAPLNPPHGQPGHDCSIPVGKPLKKK